MKRIITFALALALSAGAWSDAMAQRRNDDGGNGNRRERVTSPAKGNGYSRPGYNGGNNNNGNHKPQPGVRPGSGNGNNNNGNHKPNPGVRPGNRPGVNHKPGVGNRPVVGNRPGVNHKPGVGNRPVVGNRPGANHRHPTHVGFRPGGTWHRPMPPKGWRPGGRRVPVFRSVLGVTFGLSLNLSLQSLRASNYVVSGYGNNEVYLTNVPMEGYYWPDATLYYSNGGLAASQFVYVTSGYDMSRYNGVYNSLYNAYGAPVSVNGAQVTWFGGNNEYVTLNFSPVYTGGVSRYYTTLSFGI